MAAHPDPFARGGLINDPLIFSERGSGYVAWDISVFPLQRFFSNLLPLPFGPIANRGRTS